MEYISITYLDLEENRKMKKTKTNHFLSMYIYIYIKLISNITIVKKSIIIISLLIIIFSIVFSNIKSFNQKNINFINPNSYGLSYFFYNINKQNEIYFNLTSINYTLGDKKNIIKVEYIIDFYNKTSNLIFPSDITLYHKLHILCIMKDITNKKYIVSLANIIQNKHFNCREFFNINETIKFGIKIYQIGKFLNKKVFYFFSYKESLFDKLIFNFNKYLDCFYIEQEYKRLHEKINSNKTYNNLKLKRSYILKPYCSTKSNINVLNNVWNFINLYNYYFCFCKGFNCNYEYISQICKYYFYLTIIDNNKYIYNKTDFLFGDFIYNEYSSDDAYPVFIQMVNQNLPVHYLTQRVDIYEKYCNKDNNCNTIIRVKDKTDIINGDFLEKYLTLFLKLKASISGAEFFYINNLFYNIDYITHICLGHGVSFFKHFLYDKNSYYGYMSYNKILIPPSKILISAATQYGWRNENIIKMNLPRWDKYNVYEIFSTKKEKSIFIMFTWRQLEENKNISKDYINNILNLINNKLLIEILQKRKITLFFCLHHKLFELKSKLSYNKYITYIEENQISDILSKTSLLITDFSSIIFDLIYRNKPYIIFIPDSNYTNIKDNYNKDYIQLIKDMKEGKINFKNIYFSINNTIKKIIYYINKDFQLEKSLKIFYDNFGFKRENSTNKFIKYLIKLK